jgi:DivIVA domain-containing protein
MAPDAQNEGRLARAFVSDTIDDMEWFIAVLAIVILGVAAIAAAGGFGEMSRDPVRDTYRQDLPDRPLTAQDLAGLRFGVTLRGYSMGQVDDILDRLATEIAQRDARIAELSGSVRPEAPGAPGLPLGRANEVGPTE